MNMENQKIKELFNKVEEAHKRIDGKVINTPVVRIPWLDGPNREVWAKLECWQITGSFKARGAFNAIMQLPSNATVITASAGNHGLGVVAAAAAAALPCKVFVPVNASELKVRRLIETGARVVPIGKDLFESALYAKQQANGIDSYYISGYDNEDVIAGQGTIIKEIFDEKKRFDNILVPLGGGGLIAGIGAYVKSIYETTRIIAIHPSAMGRDFYGGKISNQLMKSALPTIADGLAVQLEGMDGVLSVLNDVVDDVICVNEDVINTAIYALHHLSGILVEGAAAVGIAALLDDLESKKITGDTLVILSGGNISSVQLSQAMALDITDVKLRKLLGLRNIGVPLELAQNLKKNKIDLANQIVELKSNHDDTLDIWRSLIHCSLKELNIFRNDLDHHRNYKKMLNLELDQEIEQFIDQSLELANDYALLCDSTSNIQPVETLRSQYRILLQYNAFLRTLLQWCSPSYDQSREVMFFDPTVQRHSGVNYDRYGSTALRDFELNLAKNLDFDPNQIGILATSSGQAAYQLIETFLLREVLKPGDTVVLAPYIYFEVSEQIKSLPHIQILECNSYNIDAIIDITEKNNAKVLFVDAMANIAGLPSIDLRKLSSRIANSNWQNRWLVIDGSLVSGGLNPFLWFSSENHPRLLYYESGSKYLQLGLDLRMAGYCAFDFDLYPKLYHYRRNSGTIMYPMDLPKFPKYDRFLYLSRMKILTRNAQRFAVAIKQNGKLKDELIVGYPENWHELGWQHGGAIVTLEFKNRGNNNRDKLEAFIELLLHQCKSAGMPLTKGVSFGFSVTRVSAAAAMAEGTDPFLRFSIGEESVKDLEKLIVFVQKTLILFLNLDEAK